MAIFPISSGVVQLSTSAPVTADPFRNGIRLKSDNTVAYAATSGGLQSQNGFLLDVNGAVICVDSTSGLPAGVVWRNGLPFDSNGALCVSTNSAASYSNGLPLVANGAVCVVGLAPPPPPAFQYYRLLMTQNDGNPDYWSMSRLALLNGTTNLSFPQRLTATDNTNIGGLENAVFCFNDSLSDEWVGLKAVTPAWVAINLGAQYALTSYYISSQRSVTGRTPTAWTLQGSNTSQTGPWTDIDSRSGQTGWGIQETRTFTL